MASRNLLLCSIIYLINVVFAEDLLTGLENLAIRSSPGRDGDHGAPGPLEAEDILTDLENLQVRGPPGPPGPNALETRDHGELRLREAEAFLTDLENPEVRGSTGPNAPEARDLAGSLVLELLTDLENLQVRGPPGPPGHTGSNALEARDNGLSKKRYDHSTGSLGLELITYLENLEVRRPPIGRRALEERDNGVHGLREAEEFLKDLENLKFRGPPGAPGPNALEARDLVGHSTPLDGKIDWKELHSYVVNLFKIYKKGITFDGEKVEK